MSWKPVKALRTSNSVEKAIDPCASVCGRGASVASFSRASSKCIAAMLVFSTAHFLYPLMRKDIMKRVDFGLFNGERIPANHC